MSVGRTSVGRTSVRPYRSQIMVQISGSQAEPGNQFLEAPPRDYYLFNCNLSLQEDVYILFSHKISRRGIGFQLLVNAKNGRK